MLNINLKITKSRYQLHWSLCMRPPHFLVKFLAKRHNRKILKMSENLEKVQSKVFNEIMDYFQDTKLSKEFKLDQVKCINDFNEVVSITTDVDYQNIINDLKENNDPDTIQRGSLKYLAKTSGSTKKSKYIPYTDKLINNFRRFSTNIIFHFSYINKRYDLLDKNILVSPANPITEKSDKGLIIGYAAGIMTMLAPKFSKKIVKPSLEIIKLPTINEKVSEMVKESYPLDIRSFSSVPAFALPIYEKLFEYAKEQGREASHIRDIWPNFVMYIFSGAAVAPHEKRLRKYIGEDTPILEVYSATESPVAYQYSKTPGELYLDVESCYFQFQEVGSDLSSPRLGVHQVEIGKKYRLLMTTYGGLLCYRIGDIVEFTSLKPPLIKILGREKEELNMAGTERLSLPMIYEFLDSVLAKHNVRREMFFICPYFKPDGRRGYHWCFESLDGLTEPSKLLEDLENDLITYNSGYKLSRDSNARLELPKLSLIPKGSIDKYILNNKQFGQGKFLTVHNEPIDSDRFFNYLSESGIDLLTYDLEKEA